MKYKKPRDIWKLRVDWWLEKSFVFGFRYMRGLMGNPVLGIHIACLAIKLTTRPPRLPVQEL